MNNGRGTSSRAKGQESGKLIIIISENFSLQKGKTSQQWQITPKEEKEFDIRGISASGGGNCPAPAALFCSY